MCFFCAFDGIVLLLCLKFLLENVTTNQHCCIKFRSWHNSFVQSCQYLFLFPVWNEKKCSSSRCLWKCLSFSPCVRRKEEGGTGSKAEGEKRRMDALQSMFDCCLITAAAGGKGWDVLPQKPTHTSASSSEGCWNQIAGWLGLGHEK